MNEDVYFPVAYTAVEAGPWKSWGPSGVSARLLEDLRSAHGSAPFVFINNFCVHSLAFDDPSLPGFRRWDCVNGWTERGRSAGAAGRASLSDWEWEAQ